MAKKMELLNIKAVLAYDGTNYSGWQKTETASRPSVQALAEERISEILFQKIKLIGSGRTDAGVHAMGQTVNFKFRRKSGDPAEESGSREEYLKDFQTALNGQLPEDIRILSAEWVPASFHSRFDATSKTYEYRIDLRQPPCVFERRYSHKEGSLSIEDMKQAAELLTGTHDFAAFSTNRHDGKSTVRTLFDIAIEKRGTVLCIDFTGNGFLYHMARILAGTLIEVGRGQRRPEEMKEILGSRKRSDAGWLAPAQGLFLKEVSYEHV